MEVLAINQLVNNQILSFFIHLSCPAEVDIPVVCLLLEGGENSLKTAKESLEKNTPVVVVAGSGRAADYIALAMKTTKATREG